MTKIMDKKFAQNLVDKTRKDYNRIATHFSSTRSYNWPDVDEAIGGLGLKKGDRILDLGCGNGRLIKALEKYEIEYCGLDISEELVKNARKSFPLEKFVVSNLLKTPFPKESYDAVISIATLHHLPSLNHKDAFVEMKRILKPGGKLLISVWYFWNKPSFVSLIIEEALRKITGRSGLGFGDFYKDWKDDKQKTVTKRYFHAWRKSEIKHLLKLAGFKNVELSDNKEGKNNNLIAVAEK